MCIKLCVHRHQQTQQMSVGSAACCPHWWDNTNGAAEVCSVVAVAWCCYPCVIGSTAHKARAAKPVTSESLLVDTPEELVVFTGWCFFGHIIPCITAICVRMGEDGAFTKNKTGDDFVPACLAETCPLCSCSPCQFEMYRRGGGHGLFCCSSA